MASAYIHLPDSPSLDYEKQSYTKRTSKKRWLLVPVLLALSILVYSLPLGRKLHQLPQSSDTVELRFASGKTIPDAKVAYATLLTGSVADNDAPADTDHYFTAARMLCYQILHDPVTKTRLGAPCLVMVTPNVRQDKIDQLREDGATVVQVEFIRSEWAKTSISTWQDVLSKIYLWQMTQYDMIAFLDVDRVLIKPLDGLFSDPAVIVQDNKLNPQAIKDDEGPQPQDYLFASAAEMTKNHRFPPVSEPEDFYNIHYFEAGTLVMRPSQAMFDHHMKVLGIPDRFPPHLPEQNLWNYIYRHDGNMPWVQLDTSWSAHFPTLKDIEAGAASIHDKFWFPSNEEMRPFLVEARDKMLSFYRDRARELSATRLSKIREKLPFIQHHKRPKA
jgi:alpha-N-acetylglucosamine transferase